MGEHTTGGVQGESRPTDGLDPGQLAVFEALPARRWASAGEVASTLGISLPGCLAELTTLELAGLVEGDTAGWRLARTTRSVS